MPPLCVGFSRSHQCPFCLRYFNSLVVLTTEKSVGPIEETTSGLVLCTDFLRHDCGFWPITLISGKAYRRKSESALCAILLALLSTAQYSKGGKSEWNYTAKRRERKKHRGITLGFLRRSNFQIRSISTEKPLSVIEKTRTKRCEKHCCVHTVQTTRRDNADPWNAFFYGDHMFYV